MAFIGKPESPSVRRARKVVVPARALLPDRGRCLPIPPRRWNSGPPGYIVQASIGSYTQREFAAMTAIPGGFDGAAERSAESIPVEALRGELVGLLERRTGSDGRHETTIPQLKLYRFSHPTEPAHVLQEPAVYV